MCDHGRIDTFKFINAEDRVSSPYLRKDGALAVSAWDEAIEKAASELKSFKKDEIAFIGSAYSTIEDNYIFTHFAKSVFNSNNIDFIRHEDPSFGDEILRKNDVTPNSLGAELVGIKPGKGGLNIDGIIKGIIDGHIKALYIIEDDIVSVYPELETVLAKLDLLIIHATNFNKTASLADIVFPAATYAEKNGTIVNFQGRVQRIRPAVETEELDRAIDGMAMSRLDKFGTKYDRWAKKHKHDARATWKIISLVSSAIGEKVKYKMAEDVFNEISKSINAFKGLDYDVIGELGTKLKIEVSETTV
jgi:NADH-quinone oxidoreductase subunit G